MSNHRRVWVLGLILLVGVWSVALAAMAWARSAEATPAKVIALLDESPLEGLDAGERMRRVEQLAAMVNRLPFEARRDPQLQRLLRDRFAVMSVEERSRYLDLVLPRGLQQMMDAINQMPRDQRRAMVDEALIEIRKGQRDPEQQAFEEQVGQEQLQRIVDEGLRAYLRDASAEAKLDLQPLIEQMQQQMRKLDRRR